MNEELFAELLDSVREGAEIAQGKRKPARQYQLNGPELVILLQEHRRQVLGEQAEIFARYQAATLAELEAKIAGGEAAEHPGWEDLLAVENLEARLEEIDALLNRSSPSA